MVGHLDDALTPLGRSQCQQLGTFLAKQATPPTHLYTSPLRRALESVACLLSAVTCSPDALPAQFWTMPELTNAAQGAPQWIPDTTLPTISVASWLREFHPGILSGLTWQEAQQRHPALCQALETATHWVPIPEAETPQQGRDRATHMMRYLLQQHCQGETIWLMSHQWIMEHLIAVLMGCDRTWQLTIPNTALFEFWLDYDRPAAGIHLNISNYWQIKHFGTCPHLASALEQPILSS
jgi:2,3-bisphosphoglycerate-dependent phosphoglycerate mutase